MASRKKTKPKSRRTPLVTLRGEVLQLTQVQVAERTGMVQGDISRLERRPSLDDVAVGTLRRYVTGLGGELRLVAVVGKEDFELTGRAGKEGADE